MSLKKLVFAAAMAALSASPSFAGSSPLNPLNVYSHIDAQAFVGLAQVGSGNLPEACDTIKRLQGELQAEKSSLPTQIQHDLSAAASACARPGSDAQVATLDLTEALNSIDATATIYARAQALAQQFGM